VVRGQVANWAGLLATTTGGKKSTKRRQQGRRGVSGLETVDLDVTLIQLKAVVLVDEEVPDQLALVALELDHLTELPVEDGGAIAGKLLLDDFEDLSLVKLLGKSLDRSQGLASIALLNTDMDKATSCLFLEFFVDLGKRVKDSRARKLSVTSVTGDHGLIISGLGLLGLFGIGGIDRIGYFGVIGLGGRRLDVVGFADLDVDVVDRVVCDGHKLFFSGVTWEKGFWEEGDLEGKATLVGKAACRRGSRRGVLYVQ
jgi:hypothetical protein